MWNSHRFVETGFNFFGVLQDSFHHWHSPNADLGSQSFTVFWFTTPRFMGAPLFPGFGKGGCFEFDVDALWFVIGA